MKIIRKGPYKLPTKNEYGCYFDCTQCQSEIYWEAQELDLEYGFLGLKKYFGNCPVCNSRTQFKKQFQDI